MLPQADLPTVCSKTALKKSTLSIPATVSFRRNLSPTPALSISKRQISEEIPERDDFASADVSFISLKYILPALSPLLKDGGSAVCLIKPQFEAGRENVGKKGVVKDPRVHIKVIKNVCSYAVQAGFSVSALDFSPVKGPEGNIEYLVYLKKDEVQSVSAPDVAGVVSAAHACFKAGE